MRIPVVDDLQDANARIATRNRNTFGVPGLFVLKLIAAPGVGQTSLILSTLDHLPRSLRPAVIASSLTSGVERAALAGRGAPVTALKAHVSAVGDVPSARTTPPFPNGTGLDDALPCLPLTQLDLLIVENAGDPFCPVHYTLGTDLSVVVTSVPEGHSQPARYPCMFASADAVVLNKADLLDTTGFDLRGFRGSLQAVNPAAALFVLSCRTGTGVDAWVTWLLEKWQMFFLGEPLHTAF
ncbi:MAG: hydrogenase nickel incorporation protein HypB [Chloroflexi bacterium]|nr:hydrogenase nickel incorporation protein HypB [Chloroflexota bacterium]